MANEKKPEKDIVQALRLLDERIKTAAARSGRSPESVVLMAVSKFHSLDDIMAAYHAGIRLFGENRVQEADRKFGELELEGCSLHLIGHLQRNKAKKAVKLFDCIQSVNSMSLVEELAERSQEAGKVTDILLELHTAEDTKNGFPDADSLFAALERALGFASLRVRGLMTMAPFVQDKAAIRASFVACRKAYEKAKDLFKAENFDTLSMGMTNDFELAIEEGSTLLRIGSAIFGARL